MSFEEGDKRRTNLHISATWLNIYIHFFPTLKLFLLALFAGAFSEIYPFIYVEGIELCRISFRVDEKVRPPISHKRSLRPCR
jgi:hypothetical protein